MSNYPNYLERSKEARNWLTEVTGLNSREIVAAVNSSFHPREPVAIYIGGSLADGYGNIESDIDVYALFDDSDIKTQSGGFLVLNVGGKALQVATVSLSGILDAISQFDGRPFEAASVPLTTNQAIHRVINSICLSGEEKVWAVIETCRKARYSEFAAFVKLQDSDNALQDAIGALTDNQLATAVYNIRLAAHRAFESILARHHRTATNEKWVFEKTYQCFGRRHPLTIAFEHDYLSMPASFKRDDVRDFFTSQLRIIRFAHDVALAAQLATESPEGVIDLQRLYAQGWDAPIDGRPFSATIRKMPGGFVSFIGIRPRLLLSKRAAIAWVTMASGFALDSAYATAYKATGGEPASLRASTESFRNSFEKLSNLESEFWATPQIANEPSLLQ